MDFKLFGFGFVTEDGFGLLIWISFAMDLDLDLKFSTDFDLDSYFYMDSNPSPRIQICTALKSRQMLV